jgi:RTX calcium-binding nonapeptide repeat (4 copies)
MVQYFMSQFPDTASYSVFGYTDGSPGAEVDKTDPRVENFVDAGDPVPLVPTITSTLASVAIIAAGVGAIVGTSGGTAVAQILSTMQPKSRNSVTITFDNDIPVLFGGSIFNEHDNKLYEQEASILSTFALDPNGPFSGSPLAQSLKNEDIYASSPVGIAIAGVGGVATAVPSYVPGTSQLTTQALPETETVHLRSGDAYALGNHVGMSLALPDVFVWNLPSTSDLHVVDGGPGNNAVVDMPGFSSMYSEASAAQTPYGPETIVSLSLPSILSAFNGVVGDLYRVKKIVFMGQNPFNLAPPTGPQEYVIRTDGTSASVQQAAPTQTTLSVDSTYDYTDTGGASLAVTGSGDGDVIAVGSGNVTINETAGNNTIFVKDAAGAGNVTVHAGSGDNEIVTGAGNDTLIGGTGTDFFTPGGGTNFVNGNGGDATVVLAADESEYSFADTIQTDGTIGAFITHVGPTGDDGIDTVVDAQSIEFADRATALETGTTGNDTFTDLGGNSTIIIGGGGNDTFSAAGLSAAQTQVSIDQFGDLEMTAPHEFVVLVGVDTIDLADATITVTGGTITIVETAAVTPTIAGTVSAQTTTSEAPVKPFAHVTIGDANVGATDTLTIALGGAGGTLSGTGLSGGSGGAYTLSGNAAAITSKLDALVFTPKAGAPNTFSTTTFTLSDRSSAGGGPVVDTATTVIDKDLAPPPPVVHPNKRPIVEPNNLALSGDVTGDNFIDTLNFVASYGDLINAFGTNQQAAQNWYNTSEPIEQRVETFDGLDYVASYGDLVNAFKSAGSKQAVLDAGATHFIDAGFHEGRTTTFNGLDYIASYGDLINAFGANGDAGAYHYIESGASEGRTTTFDGLDYIASYGDLINAFGANEQAGAAHFIDNGSKEGRTTTFNGLDYIASYGDLIHAFGDNNDAGASHYIQAGHNEGRTTTFDGLDYIASYSDLIKALGANEQAGAEHFIDNGSKEGRTTTFNGLAYIANNTDLMTAFGADNDAGATHYIDFGSSEHRSASFNVGAYESAHPDLIGKFSSNDAFLTAYINTYKASGTFLT